MDNLPYRALRLDDGHNNCYNTVYTQEEWEETFSIEQRTALDAGEVVSFETGPSCVDLNAFYIAHSDLKSTLVKTYDIRISNIQRNALLWALMQHRAFRKPEEEMCEESLIDMLRAVESEETLNDFTL